ncbi:uncharacterized protein [Coffea arabica]|uniref:HTH myb-type domain-containing protein n=1 Tax=Coffea arabica TaxID=13443 RepID=A0A6P6VIC3_COFAR
MLNIPRCPRNLQNMEMCNRTGVRKYKKSAFPRLRWTPELHEHFIEAVEHLGGKHKATPKGIVQMMGVSGLQVSHVKSHLQMYRNMKKRATINLVVPMKLHEEETPDAVVWSLTRKVGKDQEGPPKERKEPESSITCKSRGKNETINQGDPLLNFQVIQGDTSCFYASKESENGIFDFLQSIAECGKKGNLWSSNNRLISQSSASSDSLDLLHQSSKDSHVNLDLTISS